ncbi:MAG: hypothetical protein AMXMBFR64_43870 [Myxococcales bacterium]
MLTGDLVRADVRKGVVVPRWVRPDDPALLEVARELVEIFQQHVGRPRWALDDALEGVFGDSTRIVLYRGLVKVLLDRSEFDTHAAVDPVEVRRRLFLLAATEGPVCLEGRGEGRGVHRDELIAAVAKELGVTAADVEQAFHADLKDEQRLMAFEPLEPDALLHRYNTALAQAVLLKATELVLTVEGQTQPRYRALFRSMRFFGLIHTVNREGEGWRIVLDGPLSLFRLSQKYGVQMASFLPVVLNMESGWSLKATVQWTERVRATLTLGPSDGLVSHVRDRGVWESEEQRWFADRFRELGGPWSLDEEPGIVDLGGGAVLIPDYALRHEDGRVALLEIIWFWRKGSLEPRLKGLGRGGAPNAILAVSDRLRASQEDLETAPVAVHRFKGVLLPKPIIALAEQVGTRPASPRPRRRRS